LADAEGAGHQGHERRSVGDEPAGREKQDRPVAACSENVADPERERRLWRAYYDRKPEEGQEWRETFHPARGLHWQSCVWVPCEDGYLRRAPDESVNVVTGLHRSLLE